MGGMFAMLNLTCVLGFNFLDLFLSQPLIWMVEESLFVESHSAAGKISVIGFDLLLGIPKKEMRVFLMALVRMLWFTECLYFKPLQWATCIKMRISHTSCGQTLCRCLQFTKATIHFSFIVCCEYEFPLVIGYINRLVYKISSPNPTPECRFTHWEYKSF